MTEHSDQRPDELELADLRGRLRGEWKAQRRDHEREALREHWQERGLIDIATEAMRRGDEIAVHLPGPRMLRGHSVAVGRDYVVLRETRPPGRDLAIRTSAADNSERTNPYSAPPIVLEIVVRATAGGRHNIEDCPPTFQAVLQQYDFHQQAQPGRLVELGTIFHPHALLGSIQAHAGDHIYLRDHNGHDLFISVAAITYIAWSATLRH